MTCTKCGKKQRGIAHRSGLCCNCRRQEARRIQDKNVTQMGRKLS